MDYLEFYHSNDMYREYIDRYAEAYGVTVIDALGHSIPQFVGVYKGQGNRSGRGPC